MKIICPECQTEAAPGMKFCRNCGEKLPDVFSSATTVGEIPLPSPDLMQTVESPVLTPPKPPEAFKTVISTAVPAATAQSHSTPSRPVAAETASDGGQRFVYLMLVLVAVGFLAGLALFFAVYVFGEKPTPAALAARTDTELLDASITRLELCSFRVLPTEMDTFDAQMTNNAFPAGVRAIAIRISGGRTRPDGDYRVVWRRLETTALLMAQSIQSLAENRQVVRLLYQPDGASLPPGAYLAEVRDGDRPLARAYFTIGLPAKP